MPLTELAFRNAKPRDRLFKLSDGGGLQLWVTPDGAKRWRLAYRYAGKLTGSPNSFSKYGRGDAAPSHPTLVLMTLLDRRPELLAEIEALALAPAT